MAYKTLTEMREAIRSGVSHENNSIIIMGAPKSGKSAFAATIAKAPQIKQVYYFDLEKSLTTVIHAPDSEKMVAAGRALTDEEMSKIIPIRISDTHALPRGAEIILKGFTASPKAPVHIDLEEGRIVKQKNENTIDFSLAALGEDSAVIVDSGSQLADSILSLVNIQNEGVNLLRQYQYVNVDMNAVMSAIQAAKCTVIIVTHLLDIMKPPKDLKDDPILIEVAPLLGSQNYSRNKSGKYFSWTIMTRENNGRYEVGSSPGFARKAKLGNRFDKRIEDYPDFNMSWIFLDPAKWPEPTKANKPGIKIPTKK